MPDALWVEVEAIADIPFDDHASEFPRAVAKRVMEASRCARWPRVASSLCSGQNLETVNVMAEQTGLMLQRCWNRWSSVINFRRPGRGVRQKARAVVDTIYSVNLHLSSANLGNDADVADDPDVRDDPDADGDVSKRPPPPPLGPMHLDGDDAVDARALRDRKLTAEFVQAVVPPYAYIAVPNNSGADEPWHRFQVLAVQTRDILVGTIAAPKVDAVTWMITPMAILRGQICQGTMRQDRRLLTVG